MRNRPRDRAQETVAGYDGLSWPMNVPAKVLSMGFTGQREAKKAPTAWGKLQAELAQASLEMHRILAGLQRPIADPRDRSDQPERHLALRRR